jgi:hypothetical protein
MILLTPGSTSRRPGRLLAPSRAVPHITRDGTDHLLVGCGLGNAALKLALRQATAPQLHLPLRDGLPRRPSCVRRRRHRLRVGYGLARVVLATSPTRPAAGAPSAPPPSAGRPTPARSPAGALVTALGVGCPEPHALAGVGRPK